jgi:hypothetical protein
MQCFFGWNQVSRIGPPLNGTDKDSTMSENALIYDSEFRRLLPEMQPEEYRQLEDNIRRDGCRDPIVVWGNIIIDGHHRYEICRKLGLPFHTIEMNFQSREEAMRWICLNQIGRRNITAELLKYQIGKRYNVEKILSSVHNPQGRNQYSEDASSKIMQPPQSHRMGTAASIGREYNLSTFAVHNYRRIANAIDEIADKDERLSQMYLSGRMRIKRDDLGTISAMSKNQVCTLTNSLIRENKSICKTQDVLDSLSREDIGLRRERERERRKAASLVGQPSVKDMPVYDPDVEIASLSLTIPSWSSSIDRAFSKTNLHEVSSKAKTQLKEELLALRDSIDLVLLSIEEVSNDG